MLGEEALNNKNPETSEDISVGGLDNNSDASGHEEIKTPENHKEDITIKSDKPSEPEEGKIKKSSVARLNDWLKEKFCTETEVVGIEIQPNLIRICQATQENKNWKIAKLSQVDVINSFEFESLKKNKKIYVKALKSAFKKEKISNKNVAISIPASETIIKTISLPAMTEENLAKAGRIPTFWQNLVQLSGDINDYVIFHRILGRDETKKEMDVLFLGCKKEDLNVFLDIVNGAGLNPVVVDIGCFSINNLSKLKEEINKQSRYVYLKIGRDENYLQVVDQGKPNIYDIFIPENEKSYLNEYLEHQTFQQRFTSQLKHIISKYEDKNEVKIDNISVVSSEANISDFVKNLNDNVDDISIEVSDLFAEIKLPNKIKSYDKFQENPSAWAVATGLATRNIQIFDNENEKDVSETVNLLPNAKEIRAELKSAFYSKIIVGSTLIFCLLFMMLFGAVSYGRYHAKMAEIREFNILNGLYKEKQKTFEKINATSGELNKLVKTRGAIDSNQEHMISALTDISSNIPEGVWLEEIKLNADDELVVKGRAYEEKSIIKFSRQLDNAPTLKDVSIKNMKTAYLDNGVMVREFYIAGSLIE